MNPFYSIKASAESGGENVITIYDDIGFWGTTAQGFKNALDALSGKIVVRINSPGGNVFDAVAIHSMLSRLPDVETVVDGIAASAASVVFAAGKVRKMAKAAFVMIHNPWSFTEGNADQLRKEADVLDGIGNALAKIYAGASKLSVDEAKAAMDDETWLDGDAALEAGIATELFEAPVAMASISPNRYRHTPQNLLGKPSNPEAAMATEQKGKSMSKLLALLGVKASSRETFLASALADLGVTEEAINAAETANERGFIEQHIKARIDSADAKATAATAELAKANARVADVFAALSIAPDTADIKAAIQAEVSKRASAEAANIVASAGITKPLNKPEDKNASSAKDELRGLHRMVAAHRSENNQRN